MDRRSSLKAVGGLVGGMLLGTLPAEAGKAEPRRPNIVLIVIDDLRWDEFGIGGHPYLKTPNIDRIAREGVRFANAFHATPLCSPNRACILTGEYTSTHGIYSNVDRTRLSFELRTVTRELKAAGYQTGHIGKWHMGDDPRPRPGYDYWCAFPGQGKIVDPDLWEDGALREVKGYITDIISERSLSFVEKRDRTKPFFLYVGHKAVHPDVIQRKDGSLDLSRGMTYIAADRHSGRYADAVYPRSPSAVGAISRRPMSPMIERVLALKSTPEIEKQFPGVLDPGVAEETIRARAEMMLSVDESVGALLEALEQSGELDDTIFIFTSDNGFFFGEHGLSIERRLPYAEAIRMPVLIRYPAMARPGAIVNELCSSVDIAPTILDMAGIPILPHMQGKSMRKALDGRSVAHGRTGVLTEYYAHDLPMPWALDIDYKAIRTQRYKYIHWVQHPEMDELYDLEKDPLEVTNLHADPATRALREELRQELLKLMADSVALRA